MNCVRHAWLSRFRGSSYEALRKRTVKLTLHAVYYADLMLKFDYR